tara:strand:+ start:11383 stop:12174 length:792 start_codon:yes stop_codon:yes gene_type:complete
MTLQLYDYTDDELRNVMKQVQNDGLAIFTEQCYDEAQLASIFKRVGECEAPGLFMNDKNVPEIFKVSGERDAEGNKIGMFGDGELGWHSNGNSRHLIDKILIGLYCVKGDPNTTLSICNTSQPYYDMSDDEREYYESIKIKIKFKNHTMYSLDDDDPELEFMNKNRGSIRDLIGVHPHNDLKYFYFPYHFICGAWEGKKKVDHEPIIEKLIPKIFKSKYQTHHIFQPGDMLFMDQFTSLHRRTPVMGPRLLWRVASDYKRMWN